jgi:hypothetical protein
MSKADTTMNHDRRPNVRWSSLKEIGWPPLVADCASSLVHSNEATDFRLRVDLVDDDLVRRYRLARDTQNGATIGQMLVNGSRAPPPKATMVSEAEYNVTMFSST